MPNVVLKHLASTIHSFSKCQWPASSSGHSLPTQGHSIGAIGQHLASSLVPQSRAQTVRTEAPLVSVFVLRAATFFCYPSCLFYSATSTFVVFQRGFDRRIFGILKTPHRCPDATTGFCCNMQNINGMLCKHLALGGRHSCGSRARAQICRTRHCPSLPSPGHGAPDPALVGRPWVSGDLCPPAAEPRRCSTTSCFPAVGDIASLLP